MASTINPAFFMPKKYNIAVSVWDFARTQKAVTGFENTYGIFYGEFQMIKALRAEPKSKVDLRFHNIKLSGEVRS